MITAYFWACGIFQADLPSSLTDLAKRTKFVNEVNEILLRYINNDINSGRHGQFADFALNIKNNILNDIKEKGKFYISYEVNDDIVINIALRLWSGCMETAKAIAFETRDAFKKLHKQYYSFNGV